ncbi:MAG TPA: DUF1844 domain-containing protein [Candidatus Angelobacter sp.]|jgi:hypothetical protein|nr:DUF1844 domain-containing protein [Candidatus Angelobacter sp.]
MSEKNKEFVVQDRRRFAIEGDLLQDKATETAEQEKPGPPTKDVASKVEEPVSQAAADEEELPPPPTAAEQQEQQAAYRASGKQIDEMISQAGDREHVPAEMTFERLVESFYMTALLQLGAIRQESEQPRVDIIGARQTIDSLNILQEKTKGNLTEREQTLLQNVLFELRMAWIEITNAIAKAPRPEPGIVSPGGKIK